MIGSREEWLEAERARLIANVEAAYGFLIGGDKKGARIELIDARWYSTDPGPKRRVSRLRDALLTYGQHTPQCGSHTASDCDCGWAALQRELEARIDHA